MEGDGIQGEVGCDGEVLADARQRRSGCRDGGVLLRENGDLSVVGVSSYTYPLALDR